MIQSTGGHKGIGGSMPVKSNAGEPATSGLEQSLANFATLLSDPAALDQPMSGTRGRGPGGTRGGGRGRGLNITEGESGAPVGPRRPPGPGSRRRSGGRGGGGVAGQGNVSPGGISSPDPNP